MERIRGSDDRPECPEVCHACRDRSGPETSAAAGIAAPLPRSRPVRRDNGAKSGTCGVSAAGMFNPRVKVPIQYPPEIAPPERVAVALTAWRWATGAVEALGGYVTDKRVELVGPDSLAAGLSSRGEFVYTGQARAIGELTGPAVMLIVRDKRCQSERARYSKNEERTRTGKRTETAGSSSGQGSSANRN